MLVLGGVGACTLALAEVVLRSRPSDVIPDEWARRIVQVSGADVAYFWHGKLHLVNQWGYRWLLPLAPKGTRPRIAALGDSLTYGYGVAADEAWPAVLEALTGYEVLNFGRSGASSEDVVSNARALLEPVECIHSSMPPELAAHAPPMPSRKCLPFGHVDPDRLLYAVCLNDLLPSGIGERSAPNNACTRRFRVCKLAGDAFYRATAPTFEEDVRQRGSLARFARDVRELDRLARSHGLPPVLAMVVSQSPGVHTDLIDAIESTLRDAGLDVIPSARYTRGHEGENWTVSRWEGHPNAAAERRFAETFAAALAAPPTQPTPGVSAGAAEADGGSHQTSGDAVLQPASPP